MRKHFNSTYILYFSFLIMLLMMLFVKNISFEPIDIGAIRQILHPEYPKGGLSYDPYNHYAYGIASVARWFGYNDNFMELAKIFWFLWTALGVLVLVKLCNFVFKNDKMMLVMAVMLFILSQHGQIDQKTMVTPLFFLSIYYFLREKWLFSAFIGASLFYLHVGVGIWWFLTWFFALAIIFLIYKRISLKQIIGCLSAVIILTSPILYFYLTRVQMERIDEFYIKYYYYACWDCTSVRLTLLSLAGQPVRLITILLVVAVFLVGYGKAKKSGYKNKNIMPIAIGVLIVYILDFIFADILGNSIAITLQLLRSKLFIEFFSSLFLAFLLAKQIKRKNYTFFLIFVLLSFCYGFLRKFLGDNNQEIALLVFYFILVVYEMLNKHILRFNLALEKKFNMTHHKKIATKNNQLLQRPITIAVFLILLNIPRLPILKPHIKSILNIPKHSFTVTMGDSLESLHNDIAKFTNEKIKNRNALLLIPFFKIDFDYYTNHKIFITHATITSVSAFNRQCKDIASEFKDILENDLHYSLEEVFENYSDSKRGFEIWVDLWKNLNENTIRHWKKKYGLTHVIREKDLPLNFPIIYQNKYYVIYKIE